MKKNIVIFCAHSDDQGLGVGGSMAKFSKEGYNVYTYIFSHGEMSHPHLEADYVKKMREKESSDADKVLGGKGVYFFGLKDTKMAKEVSTKNIPSKIKNIMLEKKPCKIFTHSIDDMLPDHRTVRKEVLRAYDELNKKKGFECDVYSFDVWNLFNIKKRRSPSLVVDITDTFHLKIKALHLFRSQINIFTHTVLVNILYLGVYVRAILYGFRHGFRFAEVFHKMR
ncbi:MAG: PIG-L deacetylase family protein [Candidatus Woesearchaeota archaeon]